MKYLALKMKTKHIGMGSLGDLENEMDEEEFINWVQNKLNIDMIRHSKKNGKKLKKLPFSVDLEALQ